METLPLARRNSSLFVTLCELPWWVSVITAGIVYVGVGRLLPALADGRIYLAPAAMALQHHAGFFGGLLLVPALLSVVRTISRRLLLDRQSGLDSIRAMSWRDFEKLCGEAFRRRGYHVHENGLGGADGGIDLILRRDNETVLVQCKRWKTFKVTVKDIRELYGIVMAENADRGMFVTSGTYTAEARAFAKGKPLDLLDGHGLLDLVRAVQKHPPEHHAQREDPIAQVPTGALMSPHPLPITASEPACPRCGASMILRTAKRGDRTGTRFWGCSKFPTCRGVRESA